MRFQLDPFAPGGLAIVEEPTTIIRQQGGRGAVLAGKDGKIQSVVAGSNITVNNADPNNPIISSTGGSGSGITRVISVISSNTAAASASTTDYVYIVSGTTTLTLPTAVSNTNSYGIKNSGTAIITVATTSAQTIDGNANIMLTQNQFITVYSDNTNWIIGA